MLPTLAEADFCDLTTRESEGNPKKVGHQEIGPAIPSALEAESNQRFDAGSRVWMRSRVLLGCMFVPQRLLRGGDAKTDVELVRALTGINAPTTAALEQGIKMTGDVLKAVSEATKAMKGDNPSA